MKKTFLCVAISLVILLPVSGQEVAPRIGFGWAMLLNLLPSFGFGSFMQGDTEFGIAQLGTEAISWGWIFYWTIWARREAAKTGHSESGLMGAYFAAVGMEAVFVELLVGLLRPPWYAMKYHIQHRNKEVSIGVAPSITSSADRRGFDVGIELAVRYALE